MRRNRAGEVFAVVALAAALGGCSAASNLAGNIGEPSDTPERPATVQQYPAVHDMPPARPDKPLTDEQQIEMEQSLKLIRDRQEGGETPVPDQTGKNTTQTTKNRRKMPIQIVPDGSTPNP